MGCSDSKLDNLPAVVLCRERCNFLDEAFRHSQTFSEAHTAYLESLKTLGPTLHRFFVQNTIHSKNVETVKSSSPGVLPEDCPSCSNSNLQPQLGSDSQDNDTNKDFDSKSLFHDNHVDCGGPLPYNFAFINSNGGLESKSPSPPPPPVSSSWDFLNLFDPYERYETLYYFDSEREDSQKNKKSIDEKEIVVEEGQRVQSKEEGIGETDTTTCEVRVVNESSRTSPKEKVEDPNDSNASPNLSRKRCFGEVLIEIQVQFEKASESGNEVLKLLNHRFRSSVSQDSFGLGIDEDLGIDLPSLSSTLEKLLLWEKKLCDEVKAEEKLRQSYEKRCQLLKDMEIEDSEARKIQAIRVALRTSIAKLKIAFQIVDRVSISINKLRDEELWPQIKELINSLRQMWKTMVECHKCQCQAILDNKDLEVMPSTNGKLDNSRLHEAIQLKLVLRNWIMNFSNWVVDQRHFVNFLNDWLMKCLLYEPEETPDCTRSFSPSMIGAPPVFVICNYWSQAMNRLSEKEVVEAIQGFLSGIDMILEEQSADVQQILILNQDIEKRLRILEREEKKMPKNTRFLNQSETIRSTSLQSGLKHIFVVMEKFVTDSLLVYDDVLVRIQETNQSTENSVAT